MKNDLIALVPGLVQSQEYFFGNAKSACSLLTKQGTINALRKLTPRHDSRRLSIFEQHTLYRRQRPGKRYRFETEEMLSFLFRIPASVCKGRHTTDLLAFWRFDSSKSVRQEARVGLAQYENTRSPTTGDHLHCLIDHGMVGETFFHIHYSHSHTYTPAMS